MLTARPTDPPADASATHAGSAPVALQIASSALGDIDVSPARVMHFVAPLGGFPENADFVLVPAAREGLWWLQSVEDPHLTFILGDPFLVDPSYAFDLGEVESDMLGIEEAPDAFGLVMITLPVREGESASANFRAPLVFNLGKQRVMQVVSRDDSHQVRGAIDLARYTPHAIGLRMQ